jgi:PhnB protein
MEQKTEPTVALSLTVKDTARALTFYSESLGAVEVFRMPTPDGGIAHAEFMIGNTRIYISDEAEEWHAFAMPEGSTAACLFSIMTKDCDEAYNRAITAGAESLSEPEDKFWGTRSALIKDPFGYRWSFNQMVEELSPEEMAKRAQVFFKSMQ